MTRVISAIGLALLLVACSSTPSAQLICKHSCDKQGDCGASGVEACKTQCDADKATYNDEDKLIEANCKDSSGVHHTIDDCFTSYCDLTLAVNCTNAALAPCGLHL